MRNMVEHGQISGSSDTIVLSGVSSFEPVDQVDLGAHADHRACRGLLRRPG